jgi:hypothetical protein
MKTDVEGDLICDELILLFAKLKCFYCLIIKKLSLSIFSNRDKCNNNRKLQKTTNILYLQNTPKALSVLAFERAVYLASNSY